MLTMHIDIHQDNHQGETQARGVVAALVAIYGPSVLPGTISPPTISNPTVELGPKVAFPPEADAVVALHAEMNEAAPDGYPLSQAQATGRDVAGIPWDERIHASTKTTNKDGTWTRRRNTPDEVFDKVMAELKAANTAMTLEAAAGLGAHIDKVATLEMGVPSFEPTAAEAFTPPASVVIPPHVPVPPVPVAVPQPPAPPAPVADDKSAEAVEIMKAVNAKQVPQDKLAEIMAAAGLKGLGEVFTAPIETRRVVAAALAAL